MTLPEDRPTPKLHLLAYMWAGVGVLALVVALLVTSFVPAVFGAIALVGAGLLYALQGARERSTERDVDLMATPFPEEPPAPDPTPPPSPTGPRAGRSRRGPTARDLLVDPPAEPEDGDPPAESGEGR